MQSLSVPPGMKGSADCSPAISNLLPISKIKNFPCVLQTYLVFAFRFPASLSSRCLTIFFIIFIFVLFSPPWICPPATVSSSECFS